MTPSSYIAVIEQRLQHMDDMGVFWLPHRAEPIAVRTTFGSRGNHEPWITHGGGGHSADMFVCIVTWCRRWRARLCSSKRCTSSAPSLPFVRWSYHTGCALLRMTTRSTLAWYVLAHLARGTTWLTVGVRVYDGSGVCCSVGEAGTKARMGAPWWIDSTDMERGVAAWRRTFSTRTTTRWTSSWRWSSMMAWSTVAIV